MDEDTKEMDVKNNLKGKYHLSSLMLYPRIWMYLFITIAPPLVLANNISKRQSCLHYAGSTVALDHNLDIWIYSIRDWLNPN